MVKGMEQVQFWLMDQVGLGGERLTQPIRPISRRLVNFKVNGSGSAGPVRGRVNQ